MCVSPPRGADLQSLVGKGVRWGLRLRLLVSGLNAKARLEGRACLCFDLYFYFIGVRVAYTPSIFRVQEDWFVGVAGDDEGFGG